MNRCERRNGFQLYDDPVADDQVRAIGQIHTISVVDHWQFRLAQERQFDFPELDAEEFVVGMLEQAAPDPSPDSNGRANDEFRQRIALS